MVAALICDLLFDSLVKHCFCCFYDTLAFPIGHIDPARLAKQVPRREYQKETETDAQTIYKNLLSSPQMTKDWAFQFRCTADQSLSTGYFLRVQIFHEPDNDLSTGKLALSFTQGLFESLSPQPFLKCLSVIGFLLQNVFPRTKHTI